MPNDLDSYECVVTSATTFEYTTRLATVVFTYDSNAGTISYNNGYIDVVFSKVVSE